MKNKRICTILFLIIGITCMYSNLNNVEAALQADGSTASSKDINTWMLGIRQMETTGGGMALNASINGTGLSDTTESNNIDVHMEKNTEYGALTILSASAYGNPNKINDGETTTGNKTGVTMKINQEWVAAGTIQSATTYYNSSEKYKNVQSMTYVRQIGDTISETAGWHGSSASTWLYATIRGSADSGDTNLSSGLLRAYSGSIFSYYGYSIEGNSSGFYYYDAYYTKTHPTRAVVVVGEGI